MVNVYQDAFCECEIVSDAYKQGAPFDMVELSPIAFEVKTRYVKKGQEDFGIAHNEDEDGGGEGGQDSDAVKVIDVVDSFKLQEAAMDKKLFKSYFANYMKSVLLPKIGEDRLAEWRTGIQALFLKMVAEFDSCAIYFCETANEVEDGTTKAMPIYGYWSGEEETPRLIFLKDGVKEIKY